MEETKKLKEQVDSLKNQVRDLEKDLIHDPLTSLKTRKFFEEEIDIYLSAIKDVHGKRRDEWFGFKNLSLLFSDIDHFKNINDTYGHDVGDEVLKKVAGVLLQSVREGDTVARWGGEEMVVSLLGATEMDAANKAEEIRIAIEKLTFDNPELKVTISIGVASNFTDVTYKDLLKNADLAVYKAKKEGRNKVIAFSKINK